MKCAGCQKPAKESTSTKCVTTGCDKGLCILCTNAMALTPDRKKTWKCAECIVQRKNSDSNLTPAPATLESQNVTSRKKPEFSKEISSGIETEKSELRELTVVIGRLTTELTALKTKLEEVTHSLSFCYERMDELQRNVTANENRIKNLEKRDQEVTSLQASVSLLQNELNMQAQHLLLNELEIVGIPENNNENLVHIVKIAALKIGVQLEDEDVDWVTRVGARRTAVPAGTPVTGGRMPRPVVIRLLRRSKRDQIIKASKQRKNITSTDLDITGTTTKVFINERLTKENRILFRETRARAKDRGFAFCWSNQGAIYVRQREGKAAQLIRSPHDLERIMPSAPVVHTSPPPASVC